MSSAIEPSIVLAAYAEPIASGRRVLFIGPAISALPERLLERGARLVHVCDSDPVRVAEATAKNRSSNVSFSALADGHFALREGAFDVCIVEDAGITDPAPLVKKIRKALTPRGVALLASANPETKQPLLPQRRGGVISLDYYALYDAVKAEFEHVRMLGQAPFVGYVIADFAPEGTPEPSLDTAFLPSGAEEPELFIAVASQQPTSLDAFAVVQLPYRSVVTGNGAGDAEALRRSRGAEQTALRAEQAARSKLTELEAALGSEKRAAAAQSAKLRETEASLAAAKQAAAQAVNQAATQAVTQATAQAANLVTAQAANQAAAQAAKLREAEAAVAKAEASVAKAEAALAKAEAAAAKAEAAATTEKQAVAARDTKLREAETKVFARDAELSALRQELEHKNQQLKAQEASISELSGKLKHGPSLEDATAAASDLTNLEQALAERGEHVRKLERDLREAERVGKELLRQLPLAAAGNLETLRKAADGELAQKLAKSQADLIATRWALEAAVKRGATEVAES